jgi:hypothetical protein
MMSRLANGQGLLPLVVCGGVVRARWCWSACRRPG